MMTTITATGPTDAPPTLTISGGRGNAPFGSEQVHLSLRDTSDERSRMIQGWFNADEVLDALADAIESGRIKGARVVEAGA
jgi:hypothetical protein